MKQELFLKAIGDIAIQEVPIGFTGLGIILVDDDIGTLPISPLLSEKDCYSEQQNEQEIINFLFGISNVSDNRHDGFHVVSLKTGILKISQYFSPMIPSGFNGTVFDVGARYRTAQYGSLYKNVPSVIVISQKGEVSVAKNGFVELLDK
ncbi:diadenylate cyclase [Pseudoalteromonas denitrificans]|uniref:DisA checkpoint controller nucleotide-binding n=1 Tax=Pseudoalteromonas denitrificans DSM 6059 TaxID=1123010 RepID=A0A1I1GJA5_9GAMM|nr:diadenylate cyclase [Pseudoalteromonas denitrificans]SFC09240.1 DisA checkpoint controller nucleotide-binding [Pseudoalteromonas denitrificans DSM 6059]